MMGTIWAHWEAHILCEKDSPRDEGGEPPSGVCGMREGASAFAYHFFSPKNLDEAKLQ